MEHKEYVIDKYYDFGTVGDGARPTSGPGAGIHCRFDHETVMEMAEYFLKETPTMMDFDHNWGLKEKLDQQLAESTAERLFEEWQEERELHLEEYDEDDEEYDDEYAEDRTVEDFYDSAWAAIGDYYIEWDEELIKDCIDYYQQHKDD